MTNCVYTRHQGKKTPQDVSYCLKTLQNISNDEWLRMCNVSGAKLGDLNTHVVNYIIEDKIEVKEKIEVIEKKTKAKTKSKCNPTKIVIPSKEEMRALRIAFYNI
jgi:hypothetical protein